MLSADEIQELEAAVCHYPDRRASSIEALRIVQRHRGWVSEESLRDVADWLGISSTELDGVATFYNLIFRRPVGEHVILLCDSVSCWMMGEERIYDHLRERLAIEFGETTVDGRFTLLPSACLGACDRAPAMMIGDDLHIDLQPERIDAILDGYGPEGKWKRR